MPTPTKPEAVQTLIDVVEWIDQRLSNLELVVSDRVYISSGCFDVALEHQAAIAKLGESKLYGSALAMVRVLFEAVARGIWLMRCATDSELEAFKGDRLHKTFAQILAAVESSIGNPEQTLSNLKLKSWGAMNSFTHTGFMQITRRHGHGWSGSNYSDDDIYKGMSCAAALGLLAAIELCTLAHRDDLGQLVLGRMTLFADTYRGESLAQ